jgi:hypothetical protein
MTAKSDQNQNLTVAQKMLPTLSGSGAFSDLDDQINPNLYFLDKEEKSIESGHSELSDEEKLL